MVEGETQQLTLGDMLGDPPDEAAAGIRSPERPTRERPSSSEVDAAWSGATRAVDEIRDRFGDAVIGPASTVKRGPKRRGDTQWGPSGPRQESVDPSE
jgi:hypothetical protein